MNIFPAFLLLATLTGIQPQAEGSAELEQLVVKYWDSLRDGNKAGALQYVHPDDVNSFINRKEQVILSWELVKTEFTSESKASVYLRLSQMIAGNRIPVPHQQEWLKTDQGWKVRIPAPEQAYQNARKAFAKAGTPKLPENLSVYPPQLKIYAIANPKVGSIVVRNGLEIPAKILSFELDTSMFEVLTIPELVEPGEMRRIRVAYLGEESEENLQSKGVLLTEQNGEQKKFEIPVIYNYADDVTRWLSTHAPKEMERLKSKTSPAKPEPPPIQNQ